MKLLFRLIAATALLALCTFSHAQLTLTGAGKGAVGGGVAYTGPVDINGAAYVGWSTRCESTAYTGNVIDVYAPADASHTLITCSAGGILNETIQSLAVTCAVSCTAKTIYDQSGAHCSGGCDVSQPTIANRPAVILNCQNSKICVVFTGSSSMCMQGPGVIDTQGQPITLSSVFEATDTSKGNLYSDTLSGIQFYVHDSGANTLNIYAGGAAVVSGSATDNAVHAAQGLVNGASSFLYIDGSASSTANLGPSGLGGTPVIGATGGCLAGTAVQFYTGKWFEQFAWGSDKTANNATMNSNQHSYWGF